MPTTVYPLQSMQRSLCKEGDLILIDTHYGALLEPTIRCLAEVLGKMLANRWLAQQNGRRSPLVLDKDALPPTDQEPKADWDAGIKVRVVDKTNGLRV